ESPETPPSSPRACFQTLSPTRPALPHRTGDNAGSRSLQTRSTSPCLAYGCTPHPLRFRTCPSTPAMRQWRVSPIGQRHSIQPHRPPRPMTHTVCSSYPLLFLDQQGSGIISNVSKTYSLLYCGHADAYAALHTGFARHTRRLYLDARAGG